MTEQLIVWFVKGADDGLTCPTLFQTKMGAERYARACFPDETPDQRYARIFCRPVYGEDY